MLYCLDATAAAIMQHFGVPPAQFAPMITTGRMVPRQWGVQANAMNSVALGGGSVANRANTVSIKPRGAARSCP